MGLDFVSKCTPTFERSWDRGRVEMLEPDLFRRYPELQSRTFRLSPENGSGFHVGEVVLLHRCEGELVAFRERTRVGVVAHPSPGLQEAMGEAGGLLCARVEHVHSRSGAADISINL